MSTPPEFSHALAFAGWSAGDGAAVVTGANAPAEPCCYCHLPVDPAARGTVYDQPLWDMGAPHDSFAHFDCKFAYEEASTRPGVTGFLAFGERPFSLRCRDEFLGRAEVLPFPEGWPRSVTVEVGPGPDRDHVVLRLGERTAVVPFIHWVDTRPGCVVVRRPLRSEGHAVAAEEAWGAWGCGIVASRRQVPRVWVESYDPGTLFARLPADHLAAFVRGKVFRALGSRALVEGYVGPSSRPALATYGVDLVPAAELPTGALVARADDRGGFEARVVSRHGAGFAGTLPVELRFVGELGNTIRLPAEQRLPLTPSRGVPDVFLSREVGDAATLPVLAWVNGALEAIQGAEPHARPDMPGWAGEVPVVRLGDQPAGTFVLCPEGEGASPGDPSEGVAFWHVAVVVRRVAEPPAPTRRGLALHEIRALAAAVLKTCSACAGRGRVTNPAYTAWLERYDAAHPVGLGDDEPFADPEREFLDANPAPREHFPCEACGESGGGEGARPAFEHELPRVLLGLCDLLAGVYGR